jgi:hypothetical protein
MKRLGNFEQSLPLHASQIYTTILACHFYSLKEGAFRSIQ